MYFPVKRPHPGPVLSLSELSLEEREKLRTVRLAHKTSAVLLHELGHTLERDPTPWVVEERDATLAKLARVAAPRPPSATAPPHQASLALGSPPRASSPTAASASTELAPPDKQAYEEARRKLTAGDVEGALHVGQPLFARYPDAHAVQELRCDIAMRRGLPWDETRKECGGLLQSIPAFR